MVEWLLILVFIGADNPKIMTIPIESYETEEICQTQLEELTIAAQDNTGQAELICLLDARPEPIDADDINPDEIDFLGPEDSLIIAKLGA
tara:strand:+ start:298 stop:567 length:270 start_codon:yes stop_codon:yes gene_type:complete